jgi:hypothetical protein
LGLFHFDNDFSHQAYDGYYKYLSINGGVFSTTHKFGTNSLSISNTSNGTYTNTYIPPRMRLQRGLQIDMWVTLGGSSTVTAYFWGDANGVNWQIGNNNNIILYDKTTQLLVSSSIVSGPWYHIAMAYWWDSNGRYVSMWLNGSRVGTVKTLTSTSAVFGSSNQIITRTDSNVSMNMYIDELRIIDSTPTYGDTYTVPTAPYTPSGPLPNLWIRTA